MRWGLHTPTEVKCLLEYYITSAHGITIRHLEKYRHHAAKKRVFTQIWRKLMTGSLYQQLFGMKNSGKWLWLPILWKTKVRAKNILVLCTIPNLGTLGVTFDDSRDKFAVIKVYEFTKGGTDIAYQKVDWATNNTKSRKWVNKIICYMLGITRVNAQTLLELVRKENLSLSDSFNFAWNLVLQLVTPHMADEADPWSPKVHNQTYWHFHPHPWRSEPPSSRRWSCVCLSHY